MALIAGNRALRDVGTLVATQPGMLSHKRLTVAAVLVSIAFVGVARADDRTIDAPTQPSYRMQLVASDTVAAAAFLGGDALESRAAPSARPATC